MRKQEKFKFIVAAVAPVMLYLFSAFVFLFLIPAFSSRSEEKYDVENNPYAAINTDMPEIAEKEIYTSKSEAYDNIKDSARMKDNFSFERIKSLAQDDTCKRSEFENIETHVLGADTVKQKSEVNNKLLKALAIFREDNKAPPKGISSVKKQDNTETSVNCKPKVAQKPLHDNIKKEPGMVVRKSRSLSANYNTNDKTNSDNNDKGIVQAVICESRTVINGSKVKLRILENIHSNTVTIAKNSYLYGIVSMSGDRVKIKIGSYKKGKKIIPLDLDVYDTDGFEGIYIPEGIDNELANESVEEGLQEMDNSIPAGTVGEILSSAASVVRRGHREKKAYIPVNYKIFLKW